VTASLSGKLTITTPSTGGLKYSGTIRVQIGQISTQVTVSNNRLVFNVPGFGQKTITLPA
jgi:hypothetical protein